METKEGWKWMINATKAHYFVDTRSLCGRWAYFQRDLETSNDNSPSNCAGCKKQLAKRKAKADPTGVNANA